jgi:anti-anti-sigma factor
LTSITCEGTTNRYIVLRALCYDRGSAASSDAQQEIIAMNPPASSFWRRSGQQAVGPLATVTMAFALALAERYAVKIPNPPAILILTLVFSTFVSGMVSGIISAVVAWLYIAIFFSIRDKPFQYTDENFLRVLVWASTLPTTALLIGILKNRSMRQLKELSESEVRLRAVMNSMPFAVFTFDERWTIESFNTTAERMFGYATAEMIGRELTLLFGAPPRDVSSGSASADLPLGLTKLPASSEMLARRKDETVFPAEFGLSELPPRAQRRLYLCTARDVSDRKREEKEQRRAQEERQQLQNELIRTQAAALEKLSTPLIPVSDGVLVLPLIGTVDSTRAARVLEVLVNGVEAHRVHTAIIDVTGVTIMDTDVAKTLVQAAQSVRLLGAQVVLTGISPKVAQTVVALGIDLHGIVTYGTLQRGIAFATGNATGNATGKAELTS